MCRRLGLFAKRYVMYDYLETTNAGNGVLLTTPVFNNAVQIKTTCRKKNFYASPLHRAILASKKGNSNTSQEGFGFHDYVNRYPTVLINASTHEGSTSISNSDWVSVTATFNGTGTATMSTGGTSATYTDSYTGDTSNAWVLFGVDSGVDYSSMLDASQMQTVEFYSSNGSVLLAKLKPCVRKSDNALGMYDAVGGKFWPATVNGTTQTVGSTYFAVGNL